MGKKNQLRCKIHHVRETSRKRRIESALDGRNQTPDENVYPIPGRKVDLDWKNSESLTQLDME